MTQLILALTAALAVLTAGASAAGQHHHFVGIVNPADVTSPGPI